MMEPGGPLYGAEQKTKLLPPKEGVNIINTYNRRPSTHTSPKFGGLWGSKHSVTIPSGAQAQELFRTHVSLKAS